MTWVGYAAVVIILFALGGNFMQFRAARALEEEGPRKLAILGVAFGFLLNLFLLLGILFVGTGHI